MTTVTQRCTETGLVPTYSSVSAIDYVTLDAEMVFIHFYNGSTRNDAVTIVAANTDAYGVYQCCTYTIKAGGDLILGSFDLSQYNPLEIRHSQTAGVVMVVLTTEVAERSDEPLSGTASISSSETLGLIINITLQEVVTFLEPVDNSTYTPTANLVYKFSDETPLLTATETTDAPAVVTSDETTHLITYAPVEDIVYVPVSSSDVVMVGPETFIYFVSPFIEDTITFLGYTAVIPAGGELIIGPFGVSEWITISHSNIEEVMMAVVMAPIPNDITTFNLTGVSLEILPLKSLESPWTLDSDNNLGMWETAYIVTAEAFDEAMGTTYYVTSDEVSWLNVSEIEFNSVTSNEVVIITPDEEYGWDIVHGPCDVELLRPVPAVEVITLVSAEEDDAPAP